MSAKVWVSLLCSSNESLAWIWISDVTNVVPLMCVYLMFALSEASRARGVWLLCGPSLFGDIPTCVYTLKKLLALGCDHQKIEKRPIPSV